MLSRSAVRQPVVVRAAQLQFQLRSWLHSLTIFRVEGITQAIADKVETKQRYHGNPAGNSVAHKEASAGSRHHSAMHPSCLTAARCT